MLFYISICLEHFGSDDEQNHKRTANRRPRENGQLRFEQRRLKKWLKEIPGDKTLIKQQFSKIKENILVIYREENARKRWLKKKRKARRAFDKNSFKFNKKLFEEEKNGVPNVQKETLEAHLQMKYFDLQADTTMADFKEFNRLQLQKKKHLTNSPIKLGEVKDFVPKARAKSTPRINGIFYKLYKRCL